MEPRTTGAWAMYGCVCAITPIAKGAEYIFKTGGCAANQNIETIGVLSQDVDGNVIDDQYHNEDIKACGAGFPLQTTIQYHYSSSEIPSFLQVLFVDLKWLQKEMRFGPTNERLSGFMKH